MVFIHRLNLKTLDKRKRNAYAALVKPGVTDLFDPPNLLDPKNSDLIAFAAEIDKNPVGLLVAKRTRAYEVIEIQSFSVIPGEQAPKIRLKLLEALDVEAKKKKYHLLLAVYPNHSPFLEEWENAMIQSHWDGKKIAMLECFYEDCQQFHPSWFEKDYPLPQGFEIFPWSELKPVEKEAITQASKQGIIPEVVYPFAKNHTYEPLTSLGLRHQGHVVAWILTRAASPELLCYYSIYTEYDLQKRGFVILLLIEAIKRQQRLTTLKQAIFRVNLLYVSMPWVRFVRRRLAPYATKFTEYYQAWHTLPH